MLKFIGKLIPKNIAGILGVIQLVLPLMRELLMLATRVCAILIPGNKDDRVIAAIKGVFDKGEEYFMKFKNIFLV